MKRDLEDRLANIIGLTRAEIEEMLEILKECLVDKNKNENEKVFDLSESLSENEVIYVCLGSKSWLCNIKDEKFYYYCESGWKEITNQTMINIIKNGQFKRYDIDLPQSIHNSIFDLVDVRVGDEIELSSLGAVFEVKKDCLIDKRGSNEILHLGYLLLEEFSNISSKTPTELLAEKACLELGQVFLVDKELCKTTVSIPAFRSSSYLFKALVIATMSSSVLL